MSEVWVRMVDGAVAEVIPPHPDGFTMKERFPEAFLADCRKAPASVAETVAPGWRLVGNALKPPEAVEPATALVPAEVTARQLRLWLLSQGKDDAAVRAVIQDKLPEAQRAPALIEWEFSATFQRAHPLIAGVGEMLGMTHEQIDAGFIMAAAL